ncbi:MAG: hypothetical protein JOY80_07365 [Candidatus Dormibacteraeota bacterium]|nr:hypothetical protein [Candidatus Dormibacteraeota bacterium]
MAATVLFLLTLILLAIPVVSVVRSDAITAVAANPSGGVPPLPTQPANAPESLDGMMDQFPVVATTPDSASQQAVAGFANMRALEPQDSLHAFNAAMAPMISADPTGAVQTLDTDLLSATDISADVVPALNALASDASNADRINNAAIAYLTFVNAQWEGRSDGQYPSDATVMLPIGFDLLLDAWHQFPRDRALTLNVAYYWATTPSSILDMNAQALNPVHDTLAPWTAAHPTDMTARVLLASMIEQFPVLTNATPDAAASNAADQLRPLVADARFRPLGVASQGDAYLAAAICDLATCDTGLPQTESNTCVSGPPPLESGEPGEAHVLASRALADYDSALTTASDPGLYLGRANALEVLGDFTAAGTAAAQAARLEPGSPEVQAQLAAFQEASGDYTGMQRAARAAVSLLRNMWDPTLLSTRNITDPQLDLFFSGSVSAQRGFLGYSYGSDRSRIPFAMRIGGGCGAAGFIYLLGGAITRGAPAYDNLARDVPLAISAPALAMRASALLNEPAGVEADNTAASALLREPQFQGGTCAYCSDTTVESLSTELSSDNAAAGLLLQPPLTPPTPLLTGANGPYSIAEGWLRGDGLFRRLKTVCQSDQGSTCAGDADYLSGDYEAAHSFFATQLANDVNQNGSPTGTDVADLAACELALHRYADVIETINTWMQPPSNDQGPPVSAAGLATGEEELGQAYYGEGNLPAAVQHFQMSIMLFTSTNANSEGSFQDPAAMQVAESDLGVILLQMTQKVPDTLPDCASHPQACKQAAAYFQDAASVDPGNAVYELNLAWAERALAQSDATKRALTAATDLDAGVFPAWNDLGVIRATGGDTTGAEAAFRAAVAANPSYDLAAWNLGVLLVERGAMSAPEGEVWLARAAHLDPGLTGQPLGFLTDERVYRLSQDSPTALPVFNGRYAVAIATLASLGALSALVLVNAELVKEGGRHAAAGVINGEYVRQVFAVGLGAIGAGGLVSFMVRINQRWRAGRGVAAWLITLLFLVGISALIALWTNATAQAAAVLFACLAAFLAIAVHESGVAIAAWLTRDRVVPAAAASGIVLSVVLLPLRLIGGPYLGHRFQSPTGAVPSERRKLFVLSAGPIANLIVAVLFALLYSIQPMPMLLLLLVFQVGAVAFTLLPFKPMTGALLTERFPVPIFLGLAALVTLCALFTAGII